MFRNRHLFSKFSSGLKTVTYSINKSYPANAVVSVSLSTGRRRRGGATSNGLARRNEVPPPASNDPWQPVTDKSTGQVYWWNTATDETTALGAPKPMNNQLAQPEPQRPGFLGMVAEGMAFGTGMHLAGRAVSSMLGGSSGSGNAGDAGGGSDGSDDDSWDV